MLSLDNAFRILMGRQNLTEEDSDNDQFQQTHKDYEELNDPNTGTSLYYRNCAFCPYTNDKHRNIWLRLPCVFDRSNNAFYKTNYDNMCFVTGMIGKKVCKHLTCHEVKGKGCTWLLDHVKRMAKKKKSLVDEEDTTPKKRSRSASSEETTSPKKIKDIVEEAQKQKDEEIILFQYFIPVITQIKYNRHLFETNININNEIYIARGTSDYKLCANDVLLAPGVNTVQLSFGGNENACSVFSKETSYLENSKLVTIDHEYLRTLGVSCSNWNLYTQTVTICASSTCFLTGCIGSIPFDSTKHSVITPVTNTMAEVRVVFKDWKNATFPKRNDNEAQVRSLLKITASGCEILRPFPYNEAVDADTIIRISNEVASYDPTIRSAKFKFDGKESWLNWVKYVLAKPLVDDTSYQSKLDELSKIKLDMHNNKVFTFLIPQNRTATAEYTLRKLTELYTPMQMLSSTFSITPYFNYNTAPAEKNTLMGIPNCYKTDHEKINRTYILVKPSGLMRDCIEILANVFNSPLHLVTSFSTDRVISDNVFNELYPNCLSRPYGQEWLSYMKSGPVMHLKIETTEPTILRKEIEYARKKTGLIWTRNAYHCSSSLEESKANIDMFHAECQDHIQSEQKIEPIINEITPGGRYNAIDEEAKLIATKLCFDDEIDLKLIEEFKIRENPKSLLPLKLNDIFLDNDLQRETVQPLNSSFDDTIKLITSIAKRAISTMPEILYNHGQLIEKIVRKLIIKFFPDKFGMKDGQSMDKYTWNDIIFSTEMKEMLDNIIYMLFPQNN